MRREEERRLYEEAMRGDEKAKGELFRLLQRENIGDRIGFQKADDESPFVVFDSRGDFIGVLDPSIKTQISVKRFEILRKCGGRIIRSWGDRKEIKFLYEFPEDKFIQIYITRNGKSMGFDLEWEKIIRYHQGNVVKFKTKKSLEKSLLSVEDFYQYFDQIRRERTHQTQGQGRNIYYTALRGRYFLLSCRPLLQSRPDLFPIEKWQDLFNPIDMNFRKLPEFQTISL